MNESSSEPSYDYVVYIDEAGDVGVKELRPTAPKGSSEWFVLGAIVVSAENEKNCPAWIRDILKTIGSTQRKDIHFAKLEDWKRRLACSSLAKQPIRCFALCSNKRSLVSYRNERVERMKNKDWFYASMTRYLLERITRFIAEDSIRRHNEVRRAKIVYADRNGINVGQMTAYYEKLKEQTRSGRMVLTRGNLVWDVYHPLLLKRGKPDAIAGLQCADLVASAFFKACDHYHTGGTNKIFATQFRGRMGRVPDRQSGKIAGFGLKVLPKFSPNSWRPDQAGIFRDFGYPDEWWADIPNTKPYARWNN